MPCSGKGRCDNHLTAIIQDNPSKPVPECLLGFYRSKDDGDNGDSWNYRTIKGAGKSSPPAKQYPVVYEPNGLSVAEPVSKRALKWENITFHGLAHRSSPGGLPTLTVTTKGSRLPWGTVSKPLISPPTLVPHSQWTIKMYYYAKSMSAGGGLILSLCCCQLDYVLKKPSHCQSPYVAVLWWRTSYWPHIGCRFSLCQTLVCFWLIAYKTAVQTFSRFSK